MTRAKTHTVESVRDMVEHEGLGFCIQEAIDPQNINDTELSEAWEEARCLLNKIDRMLGRAE